MIDHSILAEKLKTLDLPQNCVLDYRFFLKSRKQRVKLAYDCKSEWREIPAGVPPGTKLGPWLILLMVDDIDVTDLDLWKYVDDTTMAEYVPKNHTSNIQDAISVLATQSYANKFQLSESKCKEFRISFAKCEPVLAYIIVNGNPIERVLCIKLLGLNISSDLKWNNHTSEIIKKTSARLHCLRQLKRANIATKELITFYKTRPIIEYACPTFYNALPRKAAEAGPTNYFYICNLFYDNFNVKFYTIQPFWLQMILLNKVSIHIYRVSQKNYTLFDFM